MTNKTERVSDTLFAAILKNLIALDETAPSGLVTKTHQLIQVLGEDADRLIDQDIGWDVQAGMIAILRGSVRSYRHFDSGAHRVALEVAGTLEGDLRLRIHHAVCQVSGIPPEPSSGLQNLKNARQVLVEASRHLLRMNPRGAANLAPTIKKYDTAIETLLKRSTAATVVRKHPEAKKSLSRTP